MAKLNYDDYLRNIGMTRQPSANGSIDKQTMLDSYKNQIVQSNINQKAELAAINEKANSYVNAYMNSLGLQGQAAVTNQVASNNANLMNAYSQINQNTNQEISALEQQERERQSSQLMDLYETAIANGASSQEIYGLIDKYATSPEEANYLKEYTRLNGINEEQNSNWQEEYEQNKLDIKDELGNNLSDVLERLGNFGTGEKAMAAQTIIQALDKVNSEEEYNELMSLYNDFKNDNISIDKLLKVYNKYADIKASTNQFKAMIDTYQNAFDNKNSYVDPLGALHNDKHPFNNGELKRRFENKK